MIRRNNIKVSGNPVNLIIGLLIVFIFLFGLFRLAAFVYKILAAITPVLLIATAIIDYKVIVSYATRLGNLVKQNTWMGVISIVLSIVAFPVVAAYLLYQALSRKNRYKQQSSFRRNKENAGEWINYEELESKTKSPRYNTYDDSDLVQ